MRLNKKLRRNSKHRSGDNNMKYIVAYDKPGRLRVRFGSDVFTRDQGEGIADSLLSIPEITQVFVCSINGSVLVVYSGNGREKALQLFSNLKKAELPVAESHENQDIQEVENHFVLRLVMLTAKHLLCKLLPFPIRFGLFFGEH